MSEYQIKLAGALPKGDVNGWADEILAEELARTVTEGRQVQPRIAVIVYDVKAVNVGTDGTITSQARIRRVQPVQLDENRRAVEQVLIAEYRSQTGAAMLPFDVESVTKAAFVDLPKSHEEIDQLEAEEQDSMSPTDELRRHLERVHGIQEAGTFTAEEADAKHEKEHDGDMPEVLDHDRDWLGWTRADIEAAESEAEPSDLDRTGVTDEADDDESESEESGAGADDMVYDEPAEDGHTGVILTPLNDDEAASTDGGPEQPSLFDDGTGNR